ncbi:hypothetical protein ['Camptotheca acuminata' phytoplasma]|uniref:hypothetical protein n=1 Tax='Camptotheca acuminata' phytoplasma TaxID=3239192 RepID=UPI00351A5528
MNFKRYKMNFKNNKKIVNFSFYFLEIFGLVALCLLSYLLYLFLSLFFGSGGFFGGVKRPSNEIKILNNVSFTLGSNKLALLALMSVYAAEKAKEKQKAEAEKAELKELQKEVDCLKGVMNRRGNCIIRYL